jgi:hypothetical protein
MWQSGVWSSEKGGQTRCDVSDQFSLNGVEVCKLNRQCVNGHNQFRRFILSEFVGESTVRLGGSLAEQDHEQGGMDIG